MFNIAYFTKKEEQSKTKEKTKNQKADKVNTPKSTMSEQQQQETAAAEIPITSTPVAETVVSEIPLAPIDAETRERLANIDGPFRPVDGPFDSNQEAWSLRLPPSIYSTIFMLPLAIDKNTWSDASNVITIFLTQYVTYIVTVFTQGLFCYYIYAETFLPSVTSTPSSNGNNTAAAITSFDYTSVCYSNDDDSNHNGMFLRCLCIWLLLLFVVRDFRDTWSMYRWIRCVPEWHPGHQEITDYCCRYSGRTSMPMQRYHDDYGVTVQKPAVGFTCTYRFTVLFCVLLPKIIYTLFLTIYGAGYVMSAAPRLDAFLLRVCIIMLMLYLDKVMYQVFVPDVFQNWVCNNFVITFSEEEENELMRWMPLLQLTLMIALVGALYYGWCDFANYFYIPLPLISTI